MRRWTGDCRLHGWRHLRDWTKIYFRIWRKECLVKLDEFGQILHGSWDLHGHLLKRIAWFFISVDIYFWFFLDYCWSSYFWLQRWGLLDFGFGLRYLLIWINLDMLSDFTWRLMFTGRACLNLVAMWDSKIGGSMCLRPRRLGLVWFG